MPHPFTVFPTKKQWKDWSLPSKLTAIGAYVGIVAFPLAWLSAVIILVPRVIISPTQTFDPKMPFSVRFEIQNNGTFSAHDVRLAVTSVDIVGMTNIHMCFVMKPSLISVIEPGHKPVSWMGVSFSGTFSIPAENALVAVVSAKYRASFTWWDSSVTQRFITIRSPDGSFSWVEDEIDNPLRK